MHFRYVGVLASVLVAIACARGEDIGHSPVALDASHWGDPLGETGGGGGDSTDTGGTDGSGGAPSTGDVPQGPGGSPPGMGGKPASGGKPSTGGMAATGGKPAAGGTTGSGGGTATGGASTGGKGSGGTASGGSSQGGSAGMCATGQKLCGGNCTPPAPRVGCGTTGCDPCTTTAPSNGYVTCTNNQCAFDCLSGYTKMGNSCTGSGNGGSGSGNCNPASCPQNCSVIFGPACCTSAGKCGCPAIPYVAPTCI